MTLLGTQRIFCRPGPVVLGTLLSGFALLGCGGDVSALEAGPAGTLSEPQTRATGAASDTGMRAAVQHQLRQLLVSGKLQGCGIWQHGAVRRKQQVQPLKLQDEADAGVVDGYVYQAFAVAPPPALAHVSEAPFGSELLAPCGAVAARTHMVLERTGGVAGASFRTDAFIAYEKDRQTHLCACPPSTLTERLPTCCALLCLH